MEATPPLLQGPQRLVECLGKVSSQSHRLPHGLHGGGQTAVGEWELLEREPGHLHHDVVEGGFKRRGCHPGDVVGDLVESVAQRQFGGNFRDRKPGCLRRQRAGAGHPRVHFDDDNAPGGGVDGELDVAATGVHSNGANNVDSDVAQPLVFAVCQRQRRGNGDGVARVDADGVDVLD